MSAPRLPCVALWDEMRADARVVAGGEPEGGLPPASEGMPAGGLADTAGHSGAQQDRAEEAGQSSVAACLLHPNKIAVPNGPQCVPALPVGGSAAPERFLPLELLPGGAATRNATVAGQDFRVVALAVHKCTRCYGDFVRVRLDRRVCVPCELELETVKARYWRAEYRRERDA